MTGPTYPLPPTMSVPEFGRLFRGLGRDASYEAAERDEIPATKIGRSLRVSSYAGLKSLGWSDDLIARALGLETTPERTEAGPASPAAATVHILARREEGDDTHGAPAAG